MRGLACLIVICVHGLAFTAPDAGAHFRGVGKVGVWLFFVLSAYLLTAQFRQRGFSSATVVGYAIGRVLRIYPLYVAIVLLHYVWGGLAGIATPQDVFLALTLAKGYGHLWTIPVEFKFYFLLPLVAFGFVRAERLGGWPAVAGLLALCVALQQVVFPYYATPESSVELGWYLATFLFGAAAAILCEVPTLQRYRSDAIAWVIFGGLILAIPALRTLLLGLAPSSYLLDKHLQIGAAFAVVIWSIVGRQDSVLARLLDNPFFATVGKWSYSIYLFHLIAMLFLLKAGAKFPGNFVLAVVAAIGAGGIVHYAGERPVERFRAWARNRMSGREFAGRIHPRRSVPALTNPGHIDPQPLAGARVD